MKMVTPKAEMATQKLLPSDLALVDQLEAVIDREIAQRFREGQRISVNLPYQDGLDRTAELPTLIKDELMDRYRKAGWEVKMGHDRGSSSGDQRESTPSYNYIELG